MATATEKRATVRNSKSKPAVLLDTLYEMGVELEPSGRAFVDRNGFWKEVAQVNVEAGKPKLSGKSRIFNQL